MVGRPGRHGHPDHDQRTTMVILTTVVSSRGGEALARPGFRLISQSAVRPRRRRDSRQVREDQMTSSARHGWQWCSKSRTAAQTTSMTSGSSARMMDTASTRLSGYGDAPAIKRGHARQPVEVARPPESLHRFRCSTIAGYLLP